MKKILSIFITSAILFGLMFSLPSCDPEDPIDPDDLLQALGWGGVDSEYGDDLETLEDDINFGEGDVPSSVDLSSQFPPIGDQGQYGTCVAWAVGYNHKSFMDAKADGRSTYTNSQLYSPRYLFWKIPSSQKGADCNGTGFEPAYDVILSSGISDLSTSPYTGLGDCSQSPSSSENTAASNSKILSYREVDIDITTIKQYLAQGRALTFGAKLGDNFMSWSSTGDVLYSDTYGYTGQHAYHAMILCGYDDNKGSNGAFKVVNSWGTSWGNSGYIWVDYNFFVSSDFCFCAFVATNDRDPAGDDNVVDDPVEGTDLTAWEFELATNVDGDPLSYAAFYNVYNTGTATISASEDWNILLLYYNAYNADDYGIILYDYYTDDYGTPSYPDNNGDLGTNGDGIGNWWNYVNVQSGHSVAYDLYYPDSDDETRFRWDYNMSSLQITGDYYLVIIADGYDDIAEVDEDNNYFFFTDINGDPIHFVNGVIDDDIPIYTKSNRTVIVPSIGEENASSTARNENNLNTYTRDEIISMIKYQKETGAIELKANQYLDKGVNGHKSITNF